MESHQKDPTRRMRRHSKSLLQDLFYKDTPIPGRADKTVHSIASIITGKSKLLLLESPDTVEIYKLNKPVMHPGGGGIRHLYQPAITAKASSLGSIRGSLSQSCPYLYNKRRGSFSSIGSQRTAEHNNKQSSLKALREVKRSNVTVTMTYLGQGHPGSVLGSSEDELKVLQQICGGENICVFKGLIQPGEQFQFVSLRHRGYPFSATLYVNGLMAARISSCCEYRYAPGFQQGKKSCFRLMWLAGGMPCYRCTSLRNKYSSCQQLNNATKENLCLPPDQNPGNAGSMASCPSSPLFVPAKPDRAVRRTRKHQKEGSSRSTDSEDAANVAVKGNGKPKRRKGPPSNQKEVSKGSEGLQTSRVTGESEDQALSAQQHKTHKKKPSSAKTAQKDHQESNNRVKVPDSLQDEEALSKQNGKKKKDLGSNGKSRNGERLRDFYEECVEMSAGLDLGPNKQNWFKANILERRRLQRTLSSRPDASDSDLELSEESDSAPHPDRQPDEKDRATQNTGKYVRVTEQDLQTQLDAMMTVLNTSDEVEQLVLRNTGLTDDLLMSLAAALKSSASEVTLLNLNLNCIGPHGAQILSNLLRAKPQVKGLLLFGNQLGDHGVLTLLSGLADLQDKTAKATSSLPRIAADPPDQNILSHPAVAHLPTTRGTLYHFVLRELDIGGNGLSSDGLRVLASYMRHHSQLQYLGLAQTSGASLEAWRELFDSLRGNLTLTHIILDESNLGDKGIRLFAETLKVNQSLRQVDLDRNSIGEAGGSDIIEALLCRMQFPLKHLSLEGNSISVGLMSRIQQEVKYS